MTSVLRKVSSVCPVCLKRLEAKLVRDDETGEVRIERVCPAHGAFSAVIWRNRIDLSDWQAREEPLSEKEKASCDGNCRLCAGHAQGTCCVILNVTSRCNLRCTYCFARGGESSDEPDTAEVKRQIRNIVTLVNEPLIQFGGGEPTLRDDLCVLVKYAREAGCSAVQINTNGIRLAEDEAYVKALAEAGLGIVFLQFDGTDDAVYRKLRNRDLFETKLRAIRNCGKYRIGVTLVPTVVRGVNDEALGDIVRFALAMYPAVRCVHFQPVTYLGRFPSCEKEERYTMDELLSGLCEQTGLSPSSFLPSRCDHALCEFYASFLVNKDRTLAAMTDRARDIRVKRTPAEKNRRFVADRWKRPENDAEDFDSEEDLQTVLSALPEKLNGEAEEMDFDTFVSRMRSGTFSLSCMAFQDAMNMNLERLYRCSLHVYENGKLLPFCGKYLEAIPEMKNG